MIELFGTHLASQGEVRAVVYGGMCGEETLQQTRLAILYFVFCRYADRYGGFACVCLP